MKTSQIYLLLLIIISFNTYSAFPKDEPAYRKDLTRITHERLPMDPRTAALCIDVIGPHYADEVDIFANKAVLEYRKANPSQFSYPIGAKFLKEKFKKGAKSPDAATIMIRERATGDISDWKFEIFSLPDMKPITPKRLVTCVDCHEKYSRQGFVSNEGEKSLRDFLKLNK